jgi:hypothetical protein
MFRLVDNPRSLSALSWTVCTIDGIAVIVFGAPPVSLFYVGCALLAFFSVGKRINERERRRRR